MTISTESKRGSNCTGTDGTTGRTLTLANTQLTSSGGFSTYVNGLLLVPTTEYTVSHLASSSVITFNNIVWDSDYIVITYLQTGGLDLTPTYISYQDVYNRTGLSSTDVSTAVVDELIIDAEHEMEMITGNVYTNGNSYTEFISIKDKDLIGNYQMSFQVSHFPIQSVTECKTVDEDGTAVSTFDTISSTEITAGTYESADYWLETGNNAFTNTLIPTGRFIMKVQTLPKGTNNLKVSYTYGYSTVPRVIVDLCACLTGLRTWLIFLGGQYNSYNNYSLGEFNVAKGDVHTKGKQNMEVLQTRIDYLLDRVGRKPRTMFYATGSDR